MRLFFRLISWRWFLIAIGLFFLFFRIPRLYGWDESFYVAQIASIVSDHDLLLHDEIMLFPNEFRETFRSLTIILPGGALQNTFSIGPALVWSIGTAFLPRTALDPCGNLFLNAISIESLGIAIVMVLVLFSLLRSAGGSSDTAGWTVVLLYLSSPLALYGTRFYLNTHLLSAFFATCLVRLFALSEIQLTYSRAIGIGLLSGYLAINRWQDAIIPIVLIGCMFFPRNASDTLLSRRMLFRVTTGFIAFGLVAGIQSAAWKIQFNEWILVPQGQGYMLWFTPQILPFLFSGFHGFIPWAPGLFLGLMGLLLPFRSSETRTSKRVIMAGRFLFPLAIYVSAASFDWWGGSSFGPRRMCSLIPFASIGMMRLLSRLSRIPRYTLIFALVIWSLITMAAYNKNLDDLTMLLTGSPDPFSQHDSKVYEEDHWTNRWEVWQEGLRKLLKPGFTLTHTPANRDRFIGFGVVFLLMSFVLGISVLVRRYPVFRSVLIVMATVLSGSILVWTLWLCPSNHIWNQAWLGILHGEPIEAAPIPFPPGVADTAHLFHGIRQFYLKDMDLTYHHINRISPRNLELLNFEEIIQFLQDPRNEFELEKRLHIRKDEHDLRQKTY